MQALKTQEWGGQTEILLQRARQALLESRASEVQALTKQLPEGEGSKDDQPISLAFAGQYSAGKSTILKALTGMQDIATGAGITTDQTREMDWNGIRVIDTPGIHTVLRPHHDTTTYDAISQSELLVFVITNELFDRHLATHFRDLTIEREKAHDTILVVNKMSRAAQGNSLESRLIITDDLRKVLTPFTPEDLRITFTDAESALEAEGEEEDNMARMLMEMSNINELIENLNSLVEEKGLNSRHTTALYTIDQTIQDAIAAEPTGDADVDATIMIYNQNIRTMRETRSQLQQSMQNCADRASAQVKQAGAAYAENFYPGAKTERLERINQEFEAELESIWNSLVDSLDEEYQEILTAMGQRLRELHDSHRFQTVLKSLQQRTKGQGGSTLLHKTQQAAVQLGGLSAKYTLNASKVAAGATGLTRFSGTATHSTVLTVGHMLGHSFKPWEAVKLARGIGAAGQVLSVAGIALGVFMQVKTDQQEEREDQEYLEKRRNIRAQLDQEARQIESEILATAKEYIHEILTLPIESMQEQLQELNEAREEQSNHLKQLTSISSDTRVLINQIHISEYYQ